jgi:hypothetical protein
MGYPEHILSALRGDLRFAALIGAHDAQLLAQVD